MRFEKCYCCVRPIFKPRQHKYFGISKKYVCFIVVDCMYWVASACLLIMTYKKGRNIKRICIACFIIVECEKRVQRIYGKWYMQQMHNNQHRTDKKKGIIQRNIIRALLILSDVVRFVLWLTQTTTEITTLSPCR